MNKIIKLKVPFIEKDEVKLLGAKWNYVGRFWYINESDNQHKFTRWLAHEHTASLTDNSTIRLSELLHKVSEMFLDNFVNVQWVQLEIGSLKKHRSGHIYLELVEYNSNGNILARANGVIWSSYANKILNKFFNATNSKLESGIKVLFRVSVQYDEIYGLKLVVDDVDPAFTIGDMQIKIANIKKLLNKKKVLQNNQQLKLNFVHYRIAVIAPHRASGLQDFEKEAGLLVDNNLCDFKYYYANFQGNNATIDIIKQLSLAQSDHLEQNFDCIIILRGGGSISDLNWLNDYDLAFAVCVCSIPVLAAIGHITDNTIVDEVAHRTFDTPSKLSLFLLRTIVDRMRNFMVLYSDIMYTSLNVINSQLGNLYQQHSKLFYNSSEQLTTINYSLLNNTKKIYNEILFCLDYYTKILDNNRIAMFNSTQNNLIQCDSNLEFCYNNIRNNNVLDTLKKGFALLYSVDNKQITSKMTAIAEEVFDLVLQDGKIRVQYIETMEE